MADNIAAYPSHNIDPRQKGYDFILQYCKAMWRDANGNLPMDCYFRSSTRYDELKMFALNRQPVTRYKRGKKSTDISDATNANKDFTPPAILPKFREIAISKLLQRQYKISATAIDELSRTEEDAYFDRQKVKQVMREAVMQVNPQLANHPALRPQQGEPQDMEQLDMQQRFGYKHELAQNAELAIQYVQQLNNFDEQRKRTVTELFDIGLGGYKEWLDENGIVRSRECVAKNVVLSYCRKNDYSDLVHAGELITMRIADLIAYFTPQQIDAICEASKHQWGNPVYTGNYPSSNWNLFKVQVLDFEFFSWDTTIYKGHIDGKGNPRFEKSDYKNIQFTNLSVSSGGQLVEEKYKGQPNATFKDSTRKCVYRGKWIVNTDMMYDWGLAQNMNRKPSVWWETQLSYHFYAWNFHEMQYSGILERLIPVAESYMRKKLRLQELEEKLLAYLIYLDLDAIDSAALGKGGKGMTQKQLVDFMIEHQMVLFRSSGGVTQNPNYKPAWIEATGQLQAVAVLYNGLLADVQEMYRVSGLNEVTADAPNPDMNQMGQNVANEATENSLYLIADADKSLQMTLADAIVQKLQIAVQLGKVEGYVKALGETRIKFFQLHPDFSLREFGIMIHPMPSREEKELLYQRMQQADVQGFLEPQDWIIVENLMQGSMDNAAMYLSYRIKKGKDRVQQEQQANIQLQGQLNLQNGQATAQAQERAIVLQHTLKMQEIAAQAQATYMIEEMKKGADVNSARIQADARTVASMIQANAKVQTASKSSSI